MKSICAAVVGSLFALAIASAHASLILDQYVGGNTSIGPVVPAAQSLVVGISGTLTRFDLQLSGPRDGEVQFSVALSRTDVTGGPVTDPGRFLFFQSGSLVDSGAATWVVFDGLSLDVIAGEKLFLYLINLSEFNNVSTTGFVYSDALSDQYSAGEMWTQNAAGGTWSRFRDFGADMSFRTYVSTVPEPGSLGLLASGFLALGLLPRRKLAS